MQTSCDSTLYIWDNRVLHISSFPDASEHRLGAAAFIVGLNGALALRESAADNWRRCRTVLVPPGCVHATRFAGTHAAVLHIEPESIDYINLSGSMPHGDKRLMYDHIDEAHIIEWMQHIRDQQPDTSAAYHLTQQILYGNGYDYAGEEHIDPRIRKVQNIIKADPASNYSMESLAEIANLSPTRFIHLFTEQTGVPLRRFRQSVRMKTVIAGIAQGQSITEAALNTGFTDSAHFNRAFRNMFGINPSSVFGRSKATRFFVAEE